MGLLKKCFYMINNFLSNVNPLNATPFKSVSVTNQECKVRPQIVNVNNDEPVLVLKQVNEMVVVTISMIHMQKCVFLML